MENSAPSLKIFRTKFSTSALYNGRNKTRFENLLKQKQLALRARWLFYHFINSGSWNNFYIVA